MSPEIWFDSDNDVHIHEDGTIHPAWVSHLEKSTETVKEFGEPIDLSNPTDKEANSNLIMNTIFTIAEEMSSFITLETLSFLLFILTVFLVAGVCLHAITKYRCGRNSPGSYGTVRKYKRMDMHPILITSIIPEDMTGFDNC